MEGTDAARPSALFATQCFPPETHAGANRAGAMAAALAEAFDLTVVTLRPSYPHPELFPHHAAATHDAGLAYRVIRTVAFLPHRPGYLRRGARELAMATRLLSRRLPPTNVVVATSPSFFLGPTAFVFARARRARFVWDVRDLTWSYARESMARTGNRNRLHLACIRALSTTARFVGRNANVIVVSNDGIAAAARAMRRNGDGVMVVPNGVGRDIHHRLQTAADHVERRGPARVVYAGALGYYQGLETLLGVASLLPEVEFLLVGDGSERGDLERLAARAGLSNVTFTGYVTRECLFEHYASADILFGQLRDLGVMREATFPSKIFEYLSAGKPIVYAGGGLTAEFLRRSGGALIAEPEDPESIRQAISKLLGDDLLRTEMGILGRRFAGRHIRDDLMAGTGDLLRNRLAAQH
jgi:glycosyltransferase involved in cell wall biosynthesis